MDDDVLECIGTKVGEVGRGVGFPGIGTFLSRGGAVGDVVVG